MNPTKNKSHSFDLDARDIALLATAVESYSEYVELKEDSAPVMSAGDSLQSAVLRARLKEMASAVRMAHTVTIEVMRRPSELEKR